MKGILFLQLLLITSFSHSQSSELNLIPTTFNKKVDDIECFTTNKKDETFVLTTQKIKGKGTWRYFIEKYSSKMKSIEYKEISKMLDVEFDDLVQTFAHNGVIYFLTKKPVDSKERWVYDYYIQFYNTNDNNYSGKKKINLFCKEFSRVYNEDIQVRFSKKSDFLLLTSDTKHRKYYSSSSYIEYWNSTSVLLNGNLEEYWGANEVRPFYKRKAQIYLSNDGTAYWFSDEYIEAYFDYMEKNPVSSMSDNDQRIKEAVEFAGETEGGIVVFEIGLDGTSEKHDLNDVLGEMPEGTALNLNQGYLDDEENFIGGGLNRYIGESGQDLEFDLNCFTVNIAGAEVEDDQSVSIEHKDVNFKYYYWKNDADKFITEKNYLWSYKTSNVLPQASGNTVVIVQMTGEINENNSVRPKPNTVPYIVVLSYNNKTKTLYESILDINYFADRVFEYGFSFGSAYVHLQPTSDGKTLFYTEKEYFSSNDDYSTSLKKIDLSDPESPFQLELVNDQQFENEKLKFVKVLYYQNEVLFVMKSKKLGFQFVKF